jgi:Redoxin
MRRSSGWCVGVLVLQGAFACSGTITSSDPGSNDGGAGAGGNDASEAGDGSGGDTQRTCPPAGPYGVKPGDITPDAVLYDCDGTPVHLHDLCTSVAAYVYTHAGWCGTCALFAQSGEANAFFNKYKNDGLGMWFVITSTESGQPPTVDTCRNYRDKYGLEMTVLFDPDGVTESKLNMLPNSDDMVLSQGNLIVLNGSWGIAAVENSIDSFFDHQ